MSMELELLPDIPPESRLGRDKVLAEQLHKFATHLVALNQWDSRFLSFSYNARKDVFVLRINHDYCPEWRIPETTELLRRISAVPVNIRSASRTGLYSEWLLRRGNQEPEDEAIVKLHESLAPKESQ